MREQGDDGERSVVKNPRSTGRFLILQMSTESDVVNPPTESHKTLAKEPKKTVAAVAIWRMRVNDLLYGAGCALALMFVMHLNVKVMVQKTTVATSQTELDTPTPPALSQPPPSPTIAKMVLRRGIANGKGLTSEPVEVNSLLANGEDIRLV